MIFPNSINGFPIENDEFDPLFAAKDDYEFYILEWPQVFASNENPLGTLPAAAKPMYFVRRFFLEENIDGYSRFVFVARLDAFYEIVNGVWIERLPVMVQSILSSFIIKYFGSTYPTIEANCMKQMKGYHPIEKLEQNRDVIPFLDCCIDRKALFEKRIEILPLFAGDQIVEVVPYHLREEFEKLKLTPETYTLDHVLTLPNLHPFIEMIDHFVGVDLQQMILGMIGDLIDVGLPHQWLFLFQSQRGGTGKGTISTVMQDIVGPDNSITLSQSLLKSPFVESFMMYSKLFVCPETTKEAFKGDVLPLLKSYSGGDRATANIKGVPKPVNFIPHGVIYISTNDTPDLPPTEKAIYRRLVIIPMLVAYPIGPVEYKRYMKEISENLPELIAYCTLLIPFKEQLHNRYKATHDIEATYLEISDEPEWDFFDQFIEPKTIEEFETPVHTKEIHDCFKKFLQTIGLHNYISDIPSFTKMLHGWLRKNNYKGRKVRKMENGVRGYNYFFIGLNVTEEIKQNEQLRSEVKIE